MAILEYVATHNGTAGKGAEVFLSFAKHIDKTILWKTCDDDITDAGLYLVAIHLLEVEDNKLYITGEGVKCLQSYTLQTVTLSTQTNFTSHVNWIVCTLISLTALAISILK